MNTIAMHSDLIFDFTPERVHVTNATTFCHVDEKPLSVMTLDANNLEIVSVEYLPGTAFSSKNADLPSNDWPSHVSSTRTHDAWVKAEFQYDVPSQKLHITLPTSLPKGGQFMTRTVTICRPNLSVLEGLYLDYTPKGCPQTVITQCQQYGFQRITPSVDQMLNKQTYTTTIIADGQYTNLITNGDLDSNCSFPGSNGLPKPMYAVPSIPSSLAATDVPSDLAQRRVQIVYENVAVPMATYLFFLGVGTYVTYSRSVEYPDGKSFSIELLLFPGLVPVEAAVAKLDIITDSILWTHISLGPEALHHEVERKELYALIRERETIQKKLGAVYHAEMGSASPSTPSPALRDAVIGKVPSEQELNPSVLPEHSSERAGLLARLSAIRKRTKELIGVWKKPGYKYTGQIYREISMENSQYGGMENVGNTTIVSAVIAVTPNTTDREAVYIEGVTIHEYFHNQNGSEVTGASPFEIWLNEAVTVWFERRKVAERFGEDFRRLEIVRYAFAPATGPLAVDCSPNSMAIEPEGFNSTTELISAMTYSKAPEFVNMVMMLMGEDKFHQALDLYYSRYAHGNATTAQWLACMEEVCGEDFQTFAKGWLTRTGHPVLHYSTSYDASSHRVTVRLEQKGFQDKKKEERYPWIFPVSYAAVSHGKNTHTGMFVMDKESAEIVIDDVTSEPDFVSVARNWSFFGRVIDDDATSKPERVVNQALSDPDVVNKRFAYLSLADKEKMRAVAALTALSDTVNNRDSAATPALPAAVLDIAGSVYNAVRKHGVSAFTISEDYVALATKILFDESLDMGTRAAIVGESESTMTLAASHLYWELSDAKLAMYQAICFTHSRRLLELYSELDKEANYTGPLQASMHARSLKSVVLSILLAGYKYAPLFRGPSPDHHLPTFDFVAAAERLTFTSPFMSDRISGLSLALALPDGVRGKPLTTIGTYTPRATLVAAPLITPEEKVVFMERAVKQFSSHPDSWSTYISVVGSVDSDDVFEAVEGLLRSKEFRIELAGHARTLCRAYVVNRKRSLLTKEGLAMTAELTVKVGKVNEMSAYSMLQSFADINLFEGEAKQALVACLEDIQSKLSPQQQQSLYNNIARILESTQQPKPKVE